MKHASIALLLLAFCAHDSEAGTHRVPIGSPHEAINSPDDIVLPEPEGDSQSSFPSLVAVRSSATPASPKGSLKMRKNHRASANSPIRNRLRKHAVRNLKATVAAAKKSLPPSAYQKIETQLKGVTKKYARKPGFETLNTKQLKAGLILAAAQDAKHKNKKPTKQKATKAGVLLGAKTFEPGCCCNDSNSGRYVTQENGCFAGEQFTQTCASSGQNTFAADCTMANGCCASITPVSHSLVAQLVQLADADM